MAFTIAALPASTLKTLSALISAAAGEPPPNLERLARTAPRPLSLDDLAPLVGCSPELLARVAARRQALPAPLVLPIARELGVQEGEVRAAAGSVREGPADASALRAYPADRLLGEPLYPRPLSAMAPVVFAQG